MKTALNFTAKLSLRDHRLAYLLGAGKNFHALRVRMALSSRLSAAKHLPPKVTL